MIHPTAVIDFQPMQHPTFARKAQAVCDRSIIGRNVVIGPFALIYAGAMIGDDTIIAPYAVVRENAVIGDNCVIGQKVQIGHDCKIGDRVRIMDCAHLSGGCTVGSDSFVAQHSVTGNDDHPIDYKDKPLSPVHIGRRCLIGLGAKLRPGITIGDGATVAMGSVALRNVAPGEFVKGLVK